MKKTFLTVGAVFALTLAASAATTYYWGPSSGSLSGYFNDASHWFTDTKFEKPAGVVPNVDGLANIYPDASRDLLIQFPDGVTTNFARFYAQIRTNSTVTIECLNGSFVHPRGDGVNTYYCSYNPFQILWTKDASDRTWDLLGYINNCASTNGVSSDWKSYRAQPNLEFRDFRIVASSPTDRDVKVVFERGWFDYLTPCGETWANDWSFPTVYFGHFNGNFGMSKTACYLDSTEFVVESNATLRTPSLSIQGNARQNKVVFHGGDHVIPSILMPSRLNGHEINENRTATELVLDQGARILSTNNFNVGGISQASNRVFTVSVTDGSYFRFAAATSPNYGNQTYTVDDATMVVGVNGRANQDFKSGAATVKSVTFELKNRAKLIFDHKGEAAGANGTGMEFGNGIALDANKYSFICDDSDVIFLPYGKLNAYGGRYAFTDSTVTVPQNGVFQLIGGYGAAPCSLTADNTVISNENGMIVGYSAESIVTLRNRSELYSRSLYLAGTGANGDNGGKTGTAEKPILGELDVYDSTVATIPVKTEKGTYSYGSLYVGAANGVAKGVLNLYSGLIDYSVDRAPEEVSSQKQSNSGGEIHIGDLGPGEMTVYGGQVKAFALRVGVSIWKSGYDHSSESESVLRICGGEVYSTCAGNGQWVGMSVAGTGYGGNSRRHGRVILEGGVLKTYTLFGGAASQNRGGTGWSALEGNGGTIVTPAWTPYFIENFDEAKVGSKGLTIDNGGFGGVDNPIEVRQVAWEDIAGEDGRIILTGAGATAITGNIEKVSNLVVAEGYGDLTKLNGSSTAPALNNLIVTNSASLILDPTRTVTLRGTATFGDFGLAFRSTLANGTTYTLFRLAQPLSADSLVKWQDGIVTRGLPDGCGCEFTQALDSSGWYNLKMKVRSAASLVINLPSGVSNGYSNVSYAMSDTLKIIVGDTSAKLTLSGKLSRGSAVKSGSGTLYLVNANNFFGPGFLLQGGCLSVANFKAMAIGDYSTSKFTTRYGVLEVTGPEVGATYDHPIYMWPMNSNEVFVVKNEVDVTMPCPYAGGTTGSLAKRGKGRLTFLVDGNKTTTMTGGYGCGRTSNNTISWAVANLDQALFLANNMPNVNSSGGRSGVAPLTLYEGELVFRGTGPNAVVQENGETILGYSTATGTAQPGLVLDNVKMIATAWPHGWVEVGCAVNYSADTTYARTGDFGTNPYVILSNKAELVTRQFECGRFCCGEDFKSSVTVDDATLRIWNYFTVNRTSTGTAKTTYDFRNNAKVYARHIYMGLDTTLEFDNATLAADEDLNPLEIRSENGGTLDTCTFNFRNGSVCSTETINPGALDPERVRPLTLSFDDSRWIPTTNAVDDLTIEWANPQQVSLVTAGTGLILDVPFAARTWSFTQPLVGEGGFVKRGPGTVSFNPGALEYAGLTRIEGGVLSLANAGALVELTVAGTGTLARATLGKITLRETYQNGKNAVAEYPNFDNLITTSGFLDFGRTSANPLPYAEVANMVVGTYTGEAPDVSRWRLKGVGIDNARGDFACEKGKIILKSIQNGYGTLIITR